MPRLSDLISAIAFAVTAHAAGAPVEFNRDVRPILSDRCFTCHGPDSASRKSPLRLDREESARAALACGYLTRSEVCRRIASPDLTRRMPPAYLERERLPDSEIDVLRRWIEQGARYEQHWSLIPPRKPVLPAVKDPAWARNPIDRLVLARLTREGLRHAPEADRATLLRRVTLDLTGLPPTPSETDAFVSDHSSRAYEKVVDRLLASPRYGEPGTTRDRRRDSRRRPDRAEHARMAGPQQVPHRPLGIGRDVPAVPHRSRRESLGADEGRRHRNPGSRGRSDG